MSRNSPLAIVVIVLVTGVVLLPSCLGESPSLEDRDLSEPATIVTVAAEKASGNEDVAAVRRDDKASQEENGDTESRGDSEDAAPRVCRWAIVSSKSLQQSGFPDLVTSVLAGVEGVELVERDQLDSILTELDLARVQSADGGQDRQRLSVLVGAQRLLLLDGTIWSGRVSTTVQVVDTYSGVYLFRGRLKVDETNAEDAAERLGQLARDIEQKYADGIRAVVGIPYFVSKSENEDYVSLQKELANTLGAAVKAAPGVAVLSFEEAQLIQSEMMLSGRSIRRYLPIFVTGEYEIYEREADDEQRLRLSVSITDGSEVSEKIEEDQITLEEADKILKVLAAERIIHLLSRPDLLPLTREQQEAALVKRADELAKTGEIQKAIELRETALLISPNNPTHRIQILLDRDMGGEEYWDVEAVYPHLEYLLRNRLVGIEAGRGIVARIPRWIRAHDWRVSTRMTTEQGNALPTTTFNDTRAFLLTVFPQLLQLPPAVNGVGFSLELDSKRASVSQGLDRSQYAGPSAQILYELVRHHSEYRESFADDFAMLVQQMPQDVLLLFSDWTLRTYLERLSKEEILEACQKTRSNGTERDVLVADFFEFLVRVETGWDHLTEIACDELAALEQTLASLKSRKEDALVPRHAQFYDKQLAEIRAKLATRFERAKAVVKPAYAKIENPLTVDPEAPMEIDARMSIDWIEDWPLPIDKEPTVYLTRPGFHLAQLDETTDVVWNHSVVYLMDRDQDGTLRHRQIYQVPRNEEAIFSIRTDGVNLWLADIAQRIMVLSRTGKRLAEFEGGSDIPSFVSPMRALGKNNREVYPRGNSLPYRRPHQPWQAQVREQAGKGGLFKLTLHPLEPGNCLACGREGKTPETWMAILSAGPATGESPVEVVHRATRMYPSGEGESVGLSLPANIDICFSIPWICVWENPAEPGERVAIVGRAHDCRIEGDYEPNMPLAVDLQTKKVTTLAERVPGLARVRAGVSAVSVNGSLVVVDADKTIVWHWQPGGSFERVDVADSPTQDYFLLRIGDRVFSPGQKWLAIDVGREVAVTTLAERMEPDHMALDRYTESACFRIWASSSRHYIPYAIDPDTPSQKSVSPFGRFVPPDRLEAHDKAVKALRELGGHVGTAGSCRSQVYLGLDASMKKNCTAVCLDRSWHGGDEGLRHLADLYDLKVLFLLEADISKDGLREILKSESITALALAGMPMDGETFQAIAGLPWLQALCLDFGPARHGNLGDECVSMLAENKHLEVLSLHGPAFTDGSLPSLRTMSKVHALHLWGTSISLLGGNTGMDVRSIRQELRKQEVNGQP